MQAQAYKKGKGYNLDFERPRLKNTSDFEE